MLVNRETGAFSHRMVSELPQILTSPELLNSGGLAPLLVFNNSKVRKARLIGRSVETGAPVEFLLLEEMGDKSWKALVKRAKRRKPGSRYAFFDAGSREAAQAEILGGDGEFRVVQFDRAIDEAWLERYGHVPLPPYIKRADSPADSERYQTVYAQPPGSAAAPTAGLHFSTELLGGMAAAGIGGAFITLHVGLGTFLPVRGERVEDHRMHEEFFNIDEKAACAIEAAKSQNRRVVAVGTTSLRALESACLSALPETESPVADENFCLKRGAQSTSIFIYPGYQFKAVDALFTNFHTPQSTLLMLVSAFAQAGGQLKDGREMMLECYAEAAREGYRFFSYGDAMLII
jgi:S-adenosylmethionine:tRNA ribosyltransferase-isomerase